VDGHLALVCAHRDGRSRLTTLRFDGLARASRALREPRGAVRVLTSTLGPGLLGGDCVTRAIDVASGAALVVAAQMATPVFAGNTPSRSEACSRIAAGAELYTTGEVLLLAPRAVHEVSVELDVSDDGFAVHAEIVVLGAGARLRSRTSARIDGRLVARDACDLDGDGSERALLTAIFVSADAKRRARLTPPFQGLLGEEPAIRGGLGATGGATIVRAQAQGAWPLQRLLDRIVAIARTHEQEPEATMLLAHPA
jgi:urease accessory protein UreH